MVDPLEIIISSWVLLDLRRRLLAVAQDDKCWSSAGRELQGILMQNASEVPKFSK